jgi:cytidylate kinase
MASWVVTIDGPAASGKSTMARLLAERLGATFLDTGAMYRAVTLAAMQAGIDLQDSQQVLKVMDTRLFDFKPGSGPMTVYLEGHDVTDAIRQPEVTNNVCFIAGNPYIRERLVHMQQALARSVERVVTEGRDQGTVAFPTARVKVFLTADPAERARRRQVDLASQGIQQDLRDIQQCIICRDESDRQRQVGALKPAPDAVHVDTTGLSIEQSIAYLVDLVQERCKELS